MSRVEPGYGGVCVERNLQTLNQEKKLAVWAERISACRNSGQGVKSWCLENHICEATLGHFLSVADRKMTQAPEIHTPVSHPPEDKPAEHQLSYVLASGKFGRGWSSIIFFAKTKETWFADLW